MSKYREWDILVVRDYYSSNNNPSSSTWVFNQVKSLMDSGYNPLVVSPTPVNPLRNIFKKRFQLYDAPSKNIEQFKGTYVIRPPYIKIPKNKFKQITLENLSNCIEQHGCFESVKLIHAHFGQNGYASLKLKTKLNVPLITSFYGYDSGRLSKVFLKYYKELIAQGDMFLVLSEDMKSDLLDLGFPEEKILIHHLGVDVDKFTPQIKQNSEKFILVTVARLFKAKGMQFVLLALERFFKQFPETKEHIIYKIIGGGNYEQELRNITIEKRLEGNVQFVNNLTLSNSRSIVVEEMQNSDVFLLCSYIATGGYKEGTPVVLMEAQSCGIPCISSFHAGIPEVVMHNKTGILTKEQSIEDISNAIADLYFNSEKRKEMGENARNHIINEFNNATQMKKLINLYSQHY